MAIKKAAPSAVAALQQANKRWPQRNTASDGIIPSHAHTEANPKSDHEPGVAGYCHAFDLTYDFRCGCDLNVVSQHLAAARDPRVKYIIRNKRIFSRRWGLWAWRPYKGADPHTNHMHVSIIDTKAACEDTSPWPGIAADLHTTTPKGVYVVTAAALNMRRGPSTAYLVVLRLKKGDRVRRITGPVDGWMRVSRRLTSGWVSARYIEKVK